MKFKLSLLLTATGWAAAQANPSKSSGITTVAFTGENIKLPTSPYIRAGNNSYDGSIAYSGACYAWTGTTQGHTASTPIPNTTFTPITALPANTNFTTGKITYDADCCATIDFNTDNSSQLGYAQLTDCSAKTSSCTATLDTSGSTPQTAVFALQSHPNQTCSGFSTKPGVSAIGIFPGPVHKQATGSIGQLINLDSGNEYFAISSTTQDQFGNTRLAGPFQTKSGPLMRNLPAGQYALTDWAFATSNGTCKTGIAFKINDDGQVQLLVPNTTDSKASSSHRTLWASHPNTQPSCNVTSTSVAQNLGEADFHLTLG